MSSELLGQLAYELWQTETSASQHCRREAERLGDTPPARALLLAAKHADAVMEQLPNFPLLRKGRRRSVGQAIGKLFSIGRDAVLDNVLTSERSYRGTLLGLRHGVDLVQLMTGVAERAGDEALRSFFEQWLTQRTPLVENVAKELHWFAERPEQGKRMVALKRQKLGTQTSSS